MLRRGDVPDIVDAVAVRIAGIAVLVEGVKRLALVGPLLAAVVARDDAPVARRRGVGGGEEWRPVGGADAVAAGFSGRVAVESVKRHAGAIDQRFALGRVGDLCR